ncbi:MAG: hypothetical protein HQK89_07175 [Nitrospirae bacterium]|nr:hypothetical protein [Nitrospirota bacterium]
MNGTGANGGKAGDLRKLGFFIIFVLFIIRFVVVPVHSFLESKKGLLNEYYSAYTLKKELYQKYSAVDTRKDPQVSEQVATLIYPKDSNKTAVQTDILKFVTGAAEKKSLNVLNFQLLDGFDDPVLTGISVSLRVQGQIKPVIELFKEIQASRPLLRVKDLEIDNNNGVYTVKFVVSGFIGKI